MLAYISETDLQPLALSSGSSKQKSGQGYKTVLPIIANSSKKMIAVNVLFKIALILV